MRGVCEHCKPLFSRAVCVGERTDDLRRLIDAYKFENVKAAHQVLAELLSMKMGILPSFVTIVPIPTSSRHIRQRGYDHTLLIAKKLAKLQNAPINNHLLMRVTNTQQRNTSKKQRRSQAKEAFKVRSRLNGGTYLLIDDVVTTGATLHYCTKALLDAGANEVWAAVVARQPFDAL